MKHNVFDNKGKSQDNVLSHAAQSEILKLAKFSSVGSLQAAIKIYSEEHELQHADISGFLQTGNGNITTLPPASLGVTAQYQWKSSLAYAIMRS